MSESTAARARFRATIEYDGTGFHGSQLQPRVRTVQGELETALGRLLDRPTRIDLAGRTDRGVHATAQEVAFDAPTRWSSGDLGRGLAALLPPDLAAGEPRGAAPDFHPRFGARRRRYEYLVATGTLAGSPFVRDRAWPFGAGPRPGAAPGPRLGRIPERVRSPEWTREARSELDELAGLVVGERSFAGFSKTGQPERGTRCRVESVGWAADGEWLRFEIVADRFLHHMVRYLVGVMVEIVAAARPGADMAALLAGERPSRGVSPAPPGGLYLTGVEYDDGWNRPGGVRWLGTLDQAE